MNNFNLFKEFRKSWWFFIIDNAIYEYIFSYETCFFKNIINLYYFHMVYQKTSSSEYLFFSFSSGFFTYQIHHYSTLNDQLHHYSPTSSLLINLISLSVEAWIFWQLPFGFRVSSYFLSFFGYCECWLPCVRLRLYYEINW